MSGRKLAVIGNSHVAAIKRAWAMVQDAYPGTTITFFARPEGLGGITALRPGEGRLTPEDAQLANWFRRTAGSAVMDAGHYDAFWLYGLEGPDAKQLHWVAATVSQRTFSTGFAEVYFGDFRDRIRDHARRSQTFELARLIRSITPKPVCVSPKPFSASRARNSAFGADYSRILANFNDSMTQAFAEISCHFVPQPPATTEDHIYGRDEYTKEDGRHMTADFGVLCLHALLGPGGSLAEIPDRPSPLAPGSPDVRPPPVAAHDTCAATSAPDDDPYGRQPEHAFWRKAVQDRHPLDIRDWYRAKFPVSGARIATAGSCFAQHIGRELREKGFRYVDVEPPPEFLKRDSWLDFGYGMYSARYGNIYTSRQLVQLIRRSLGEFKPVERAWKKGEGFVDPFRPTIEPQPAVSQDEVELSRTVHLDAVAGMFQKTDVFVFTLGLTETWVAVKDGAAFPVAPGTAGGSFDPAEYRLHNLRYAEIRADLEAFFSRARSINPRMKFLLTVSPVPLMATATDQHVLSATSYSKSLLRAVAGDLAARHAYVDYFPSYEIISSHVMRGQFYNPDLRTVSLHGVHHVMRQFFKEHAPPAARAGAMAAVAEEPPPPAVETSPPPPLHGADAIACDEELLAAFGDAAPEDGPPEAGASLQKNRQ